jgi:hypothetical protein
MNDGELKIGVFEPFFVVFRAMRCSIRYFRHCPYVEFAVGIIGSGSQIISNNTNDNVSQGSQIDSADQGSQFLNGWEFAGCAGGPAFAFGSLVNASFLALFYRFYRGAYGKKSQKNEKSE